MTLLLGVWAGSWADGKLGTEPWLLVTGSLLGTGTAMYMIVRETSRLGR